MKRTQFNQTEMFQTVANYMLQHRPIWEGTKAVQDTVVDLQERIRLIMEKIRRQHSPTSGATDEKGQVRRNVEQFILEMAGQLRALAARTQNIHLAAQSELVHSVLDRMAGDELEGTAQRILALMTTHLAALADFGITAKEVASMEAFIEQYRTAKSAPRTAIADRASETVTIPGLIRQTTRLLRQQLDKVMIRYRSTHPEFHAGYLVARNIVERGGSPRGTAPSAEVPPSPAATAQA